MQNLLNKGITYFEGFTQEQWIWMAVAGVILIYILYNRKKYINLFDGAVIMAETSFKHGENKKKLNAAVKFVEVRTETLPIPAKLLIRYFLSRKRIIYVIEKTLQKFSNVFATGRKIDIDEEEENGDN